MHGAYATTIVKTIRRVGWGVLRAQQFNNAYYYMHPVVLLYYYTEYIIIIVKSYIFALGPTAKTVPK